MFFKDTADFKKIVSVNVNFAFTELRIFLEQTDLLILTPFLGEDFIQELNDAFTNANGLIDNVPDPEKKLIIKLRNATGAFSLAAWIPQGQLSIDQAGIRIANTETHKTAFEWQINNLETSLNNLGYTFLDDALNHLHKHLDDFPTYKVSEEYKENSSLFVSSAKEFIKHCSPFKNSVIAIYRLRSIIRKVEEFDIQSIILPDQFTDLKTKMAAGIPLGSYALALIEKIKPCVVNLTIARAVNELSCQLDAQGFLVFDSTGSSPTINKKKQTTGEAVERIRNAAERDGNTYLGALAVFIEKNKANYPLFANDALYTAPADTVDLNSGDDKNYFAAL